MHKRGKQIRLGDLLIDVGKISEEQLALALKIQKEKKMKLGEVLKELGFVTDNDILEVLEFQLGITRVDLNKYVVDPEVSRIISEEFARKNLLIPIKKAGNTLIVAMNDPLNIILINDLEIMTNMVVQPMMASETEILDAIVNYFSKQSAEKAVEEFTREFNLVEDQVDEELLNEINKAPVVRLINTIIIQAAQSKASDIHIEPDEQYMRIRFRIDGDLQEIMRPGIETHGAVLTRIKIMAKMNIAEKRIPQDGRIEMFMKGRDLDLRVSTIPTIYGEKIVIRMMDRQNFLKSKEKLGMREEHMELFDSILRSKHGIILVTGPTGSGKSTTMYAMLYELNDEKRNIITIEDPVEYRMQGIVQSQVNIKAGYDFAYGLRSMLRQDPDVIMVGEIRDNETAEIATKAAITGHLVLSTLHTNSAAATINRLIDMDTEPYLVASSIVAILSQALVKKNCPECKIPYQAEEQELGVLSLEKDSKVTLFRPVGCDKCHNTGYLGRTAVYEILKLDSHSRRMIIERKPVEDIREYHKKNGMVVMQESCKRLLLEGVTSFEEYMKLTYSIET